MKKQLPETSSRGSSLSAWKTKFLMLLCPRKKRLRLKVCRSEWALKSRNIRLNLQSGTRLKLQTAHLKNLTAKFQKLTKKGGELRFSFLCLDGKHPWNWIFCR